MKITGDLVWTVFLLTFFIGLQCEIVYKWKKANILAHMGQNNWRVTSFALTKHKIFMTLIEIDSQTSGNGVVVVFNKSATTSPEVRVFPFENFYKISDPLRGRVTTPMSVRSDECDRLWLLDSAVQNISGIQIKTNPGIYVFNTQNSQLVRTFNVPASHWSSTSFFVNFIIETDNSNHDCEESFGYFADFNRFQLLTYDFRRNRSELKFHPFFSPDPLIHIPNEVLFNTGHQDLNGIFGLALAEHRSSGVDSVYLHPLAGTHEFRINKQALKSEDKLNYKDVEIYTDKGKDTESGVSVFDSDTNKIFFAEVNTKRIGVLQLEEPVHTKQATYYRYDFNLKTGCIVDLSIQNSELWALIDDKTEIAIHKLSVADIRSESPSVERNDVKSQTGNSANLTFFKLDFFHIIIVLGLHCIYNSLNK